MFFMRRDLYPFITNADDNKIPIICLERKNYSILYTLGDKQMCAFSITAVEQRKQMLLSVAATSANRC